MGKDLSTSASRTTAPPFALSWIDLIVARIDRLPGAASFFYLFSLSVLIVLFHIAFWIDGALPVGSTDLAVVVNVFFIVYWLALYHYLTEVGSRSLRLFRPLMQSSDSEIPRIEFRFSNLPQWLGWLAAPIGVLFGLAQILPGSNPFGDLVPRSSLPLVLDVIATMFLASTFFCLIFRSLRQLRMVRSLHRQALNINLLKLEPAHAFSILTSRTGMGVIFVMIFAYLLQPSAFQSPFNLITVSAVNVIALAIFVVPIIGIRAQIEDEKQRAIDTTSDLIQSASDDLHSKVRRRDYEEFKGIEDTIAALIRERELLQSVPTWPWNPRTIRGFASALVLPIVLWLITRLLERVL